MGFYTKICRSVRGRFRNRMLSNYGFGIAAETKNGTFIVDPKDFGVGRTLLRDGEYDINDLNLLLNLVQPDFNAVFIGAHVGPFLVPISKKVKQVIGYEANPHSFKLLEYNCVLNNVSNCKLYNYCVGDRNVFIELEIDSINTGHSRINPKSLQKNVDDTENSIEMIAFDSHQNNIEVNYDLIVIDVEGAECMVLEGMQESLKYCKYLNTEFGPNSLHDYGYSPEQFIGLIKPHFPYMCYIMYNRLKKFPKHCWEQEINKLSNEEPKPLINLLFSKTEVSDEAFQHTE